jgi:hypothetical protein
LVAVVHAIASSSLYVLLIGSGWIFQAVPFHFSTSAIPLPELFVYPPTAMQKEVEIHLTLSSLVFLAPLGIETDWIFQLVPFQRSASA